jgi:hypothetical protein
MNAIKFIKQISLVLLLLCGASIHTKAQELIDEDFVQMLNTNSAEMWNEADPDFANGNAIPEKWNKESAVVYGFKSYIFFDKKKKGGFLSNKNDLLVLEKRRFKIKLLDNSAVDGYSTLYFRYANKIDGFSAVVYKQDGSKLVVPMTKAVTIEDNDDVPYFFKSFFDQNVSNRSSYYKVPVADLVPGDIIEYVSLTSSALNVTNTNYFEFDEQYELCSKGIPVMLHKIVVETDDKSFLKAKSMNGAPEFSQTNNGEITTYTWIDKNRDKYKNISFLDDFIMLPLMKYQITYTNGKENNSSFAGAKGVIKSSFDPIELARKAAKKYLTLGNTFVTGTNGATVTQMINMLYGKMKKLDAREMDDEEYIRLAYYMVRHAEVFNRYSFSDRQYLYTIGALLDYKKIPYDIIITNPKNTTKFEDVLFESEISWVMRTNNKFIVGGGQHTNPFDFRSNFLNNVGYTIPIKRGEEPTKVTLPNTTQEENKNSVVYEAESILDSSQIKIVRNTKYTGILKTRNIGEVLESTPYSFNDYKTFNGNDEIDEIQGPAQDRIYDQIDNIKREMKQAKPKQMKENIESEYNDKISFESYEIVNDGRVHNKPDLIYKETFKLNSKTKRAGNKYLIELPSLIGGQLQIRKEDRERNYDINVAFPKKFEWSINYKIPAGYSAFGYKDLETNIDNEAGIFKVETEIAGDILKIKITKIYKMAEIPLAKWNDMLAFVDAAYNFSKKMILLKPNK